MGSSLFHLNNSVSVYYSSGALLSGLSRPLFAENQNVYMTKVSPSFFSLIYGSVDRKSVV